MRWDEISSAGSTNNIHCLIMYSIRHQVGWTTLHYAASSGHTEVAKLLLDRGVDVNSKDEVSDVIWDIVMIICVIQFVPKLCDSNVIAITTSQH